MPFYIVPVETRARVTSEHHSFIVFAKTCHRRPKRFRSRDAAEAYLARRQERLAHDWPWKAAVLVEAATVDDAHDRARQPDSERSRAIAALLRAKAQAGESTTKRRWRWAALGRRWLWHA